MSGLKLILINLGVYLSLLAGGMSQPEEPDLLLDEVISLLDEVAPLPDWELEVAGTSFSVLPTDDAPDYELLRLLLEQDEFIDERQQREDVLTKGLYRYLNHREVLFLSDADREISNVNLIEIQGLLTSHAGESAYNLHTVLLPKDYVELVSQFSEERIFDVLRYDQDAILVFFFYDDPGHSRLFFGAHIREVVPGEVRAEIVTSATNEARIGEGVYESLIRLLSDASLRLLNFEGAMVDSNETSEEKVIINDQEVSASLNSQIKKSNIDWLLMAIIGATAAILIALTFMVKLSGRRRIRNFPITDKVLFYGLPRSQKSSMVMEFGEDSKKPDKQLYS